MARLTRLSGEDLRGQLFDRSFRGYDCGQVDHLVERCRDEFYRRDQEWGGDPRARQCRVPASDRHRLRVERGGQEWPRRGSQYRPGAKEGVVVMFDHDIDRTAELGRLLAAEYSCCSSASYHLTIDARGVRIEIHAPDEGREALAARFST
jgi:DivIVA domain-containing protein